MSVSAGGRRRTKERTSTGEPDLALAIECLEQVLAVRVHLDDCDEHNGALRVVPGSHRFGRLSADDARKVREANGEVSVAVPCGGVMLMRPLLLHASSKCSSERPRRVLHFVFEPEAIPHGLRWRYPTFPI